jgi:hypothetical protein
MNRALSSSLIAIALTLPAWNAAAGGPRGGQPARDRLFDPATVTSVSGQVEEVQRYERRRNAGVHVLLRTSEGTLDVHLGPEAYLQSQGLSLAKGDELEVTGSKVQLGGSPALIAQTVKKGEAKVTLRDANGVPAWAGGRGRGW